MRSFWTFHHIRHRICRPGIKTKKTLHSALDTKKISAQNTLIKNKIFPQVSNCLVLGLLSFMHILQNIRWNQKFFEDAYTSPRSHHPWSFIVKFLFNRYFLSDKETIWGTKRLWDVLKSSECYILCYNVLHSIRYSSSGCYILCYNVLHNIGYSSARVIFCASIGFCSMTLKPLSPIYELCYISWAT